MAEVFIGTSGWVYDSWRGFFYPDDLPMKDELTFFADEFSTVEINYTFYKLPEPASYINWFKQVPDDFLFAVKASRFLTHMKKLTDAEDPWDRIVDRARKLKDKCGPILLQFPENWKKNKERLVDFFQVVEQKSGPKHRLVFELRNESWASGDIYKLLEEHGAAWCIADTYKFKRFDVATAPFVYIRYHAMRASNPNYTFSRLEKEAKKIKQFQDNGYDVYVYFNNDTNGYAINNARTLKQLLA